MSTAFANVPAIPFEGPTSTNPLAFKFYNKDQVILGRKMRDWCNFSVCFWHTFRGIGSDPFGAATLERPWKTLDETAKDSTKILQDCKERIDAAFEFFVKLGVDYYTYVVDPFVPSFVI
jgi:xylose isomerase